MSTILDTIAAATRTRVQKEKERLSMADIKRQCAQAQEEIDRQILDFETNQASRHLGNGLRFVDALAKPGLSFICEVKKASPSKGIISEDFPYLEIARDYEEAGADCVSCLTEPQWFKGSDEIFREIRTAIDTPMIRKDFVVDEYQLYQARLMGADAVLLICAILDQQKLSRYLEITHELGMAALVETHDEEEIEQALEVGARLIGVNNRNLHDFSVDFSTSRRLRSLIPDDRIFVAESGVKGPEDIAAVAAMGADAVLVGEALMRSNDKSAALEAMRQASAKKFAGKVQK